jgi:hypothetical protein
MSQSDKIAQLERKVEELANEINILKKHTHSYSYSAVNQSGVYLGVVNTTTSLPILPPK